MSSALVTDERPASSLDAAETPVLEIRHVTKLFGSVEAVSDASLVLPPGKTMVLLGESGSGKTTILRCVAGLENVTQGEILMEGSVIADGRRGTAPESRRVGMVFQNYALWPHMTAADNIAFAGRRSARGREVRRKAKEQAIELLHTVGLGHLGDRLPGQLSGGQQQRVALARALAGDVRLLLMDEPLSALDQALREELRLELRAQIKKSGLACLYVTHDQQEALAMADVLVVMKSGKIMELGDPRKIYERPATSFGAAFLGATNAARGIVVEVGETYAVAQVGDERLVFHPSDAGLVAGSSVEMRWRREHTTVVGGTGPAGPLGVNEWRGEAVSAVYLGHAWEAAVDLLGGRVRALCRTELSGDVVISVEPARVIGYACDPIEQTGVLDAVVEDDAEVEAAVAASEDHPETTPSPSGATS